MSVMSTFDSLWSPQIYLSIMKIYNRHYYYVLYFEAVAKVAVRPFLANLSTDFMIQMTLAECMGPSLLLNLKVSFQRLKFKVPMYWTWTQVGGVGGKFWVKRLNRGQNGQSPLLKTVGFQRNSDFTVFTLSDIARAKVLTISKRVLKILSIHKYHE